jgi:radical SAM protein with 4Fe4S-binding SPASM domain
LDAISTASIIPAHGVTLSLSRINYKLTKNLLRATMVTMSKYRKFLQTIINSNIPINCLFELTYRCNLRCVHCYIVRAKKREISTRQAFEVLRQLREAGCLYIVFSGGEILVRDDFFEVAGYARKLNFALRLFTNGTLINPRIADKIKALNPLSVDISLYGFEETHEAITQIRGSFQKTLDAITLLRDRGIRLIVKTTLLRQNVQDIWRLNRLLKEKLRVRTLNVGGSLVVSPCDNGKRTPLVHRLTGQQLREYMIEESWQLKRSGNDFKPKMIKGNDRLCGSGLINCNVTPYGAINPCAQIRLKTGNNIKYTPFLTIWNNKDFMTIRNLRLRDRKGCIKCKLIHYCTYCPGIALLENGSLFAPSQEFCRIARIRREAYAMLHPPSNKH